MKKICKNRGYLVKTGLKNYYHTDWTVSKKLLTRQRSTFHIVPTNCSMGKKICDMRSVIKSKMEQKHRDKDRKTTFKILFIHKYLILKAKH